MPIEFRCHQCGKLLRTADDTAGRQAKCPSCATLLTVPAGPSPEQGTSASSDSDIPVAPSTAGTLGPAPPSWIDPNNPFQSPQSTGASPVSDPEYARQRVAAPATALLVLAIICIGLNLLSVAAYGSMIALGPPGGGAGRNEELLGSAILVGAGVLGLLVNALTIYGSLQMKSLASYGWAMTAAILSIIPCTGCCIIVMPFGIWALVVLIAPEVKGAFQR